MKSNLIPLVKLIDIDRQVQRIRESADTIFFFETYPTQSLVFPLQTFDAGGYNKYTVTITPNGYNVSAPVVVANHVWHIIADEYLPPGWNEWGIQATNKAAVGAAIDKASSSAVVPTQQNATTGEVSWSSINDSDNWFGGVWDAENNVITGGIGSIITDGTSSYMVTDILCKLDTYTSWLKRVGNTVTEIPRFEVHSPEIGLDGQISVYDNISETWIEGAYAYDATPKLLADYTFGQSNAIQSDLNGSFSKIRNVQSLSGWFWPVGNKQASLSLGSYEGQLLSGISWGNVRRIKTYKVYGRLITPVGWEMPQATTFTGLLPQLLAGGLLAGSVRGKTNIRINSVISALTLERILKGGNEWQQPE